MFPLLFAIGVASSQFAYAQHPAEPSLEQFAVTVATRCMTAHAPENWDVLVAWLDKSKPSLITVGAQAHTKGATKDVPLQLCDVKTQAEILSSFIPKIPANQAGWKVLYLRLESNNTYKVFTDVAIKQTNK